MSNGTAFGPSRDSSVCLFAVVISNYNITHHWLLSSFPLVWCCGCIRLKMISHCAKCSCKQSPSRAVVAAAAEATAKSCVTGIWIVIRHRASASSRGGDQHLTPLGLVTGGVNRCGLGVLVG